MPKICMFLVSVILLLVGCGKTETISKPLTLATTTSTRDSGLLDVLVPMFEKEAGVPVKVVAVGSGQALELGRRGDADVLLTHSPAAEEKFIEEGHGVRRQLVMYNDFVLVGPMLDPAHVKGGGSITSAFTKIATSQSTFVSRGDDSGTHVKETQIWKQADFDPEGAWYIEAGSGMAETLRMASEKDAYTLSDRGTFLAHRERLQLQIVAQGDDSLRNQYAVIVVSPEKHPCSNAATAQRFTDFLLSSKAQRVIAEFGVETYGEALFTPE